jgi:hypothetical protein
MDGDSVRANFKNSLRNAKENFTNSKSRIVLDKNELESLKKIRENSIQTAVDDFKRSAEDAKNKLLQSLNS